MSKKILIICGTFILVLVILGGFFFLRQGKISLPVSPLPGLGSSPQTKTGEFLLYEDEAGFSFQYPKTLGIVEVETTKSDVYSSLELLSKEHPGEKITLRITDTGFSSIDKWLEKNLPEGEIVSLNEANLVDIKGKQIRFDTKKMVTVAIESGILYLLEGPADGGFWEEAQKTILSNFAFIPPETSAGSAGSSIIDEGEEIVE